MLSKCGHHNCSIYGPLIMDLYTLYAFACVCMCVCACEKERERWIYDFRPARNNCMSLQSISLEPERQALHVSRHSWYVLVSEYNPCTQTCTTWSSSDLDLVLETAMDLHSWELLYSSCSSISSSIDFWEAHRSSNSEWFNLPIHMPTTCFRKIMFRAPQDNDIHRCRYLHALMQKHYCLQEKSSEAVRKSTSTRRRHGQISNLLGEDGNLAVESEAAGEEGMCWRCGCECVCSSIHIHLLLFACLVVRKNTFVNGISKDMS